MNGVKYSMHWDVVEVKPEPYYRLFVRFKDGVAGHVQLRQKDLTGALAPIDLRMPAEKIVG
jgi:hypothetical protein